MDREKQNKIMDKARMKIAISNFKKEEEIEMRKTNRSILKIASVACIAIALITGGVFAKDIENIFRRLFEGASDGVIIAVDNGYVAKTDGEVQTAEGIEISVDSFMIDDYNFIMNFKFKINEESNINDFVGIDIRDLKIIDENETCVFNTHEAILGNSEIKLEDKYLGGYSFGFDKISDNEYICKLMATGNPKAFPNSKHLSISFTELQTCKLIYTNGSEEKERKIYKGNWNFEIDVPEEFYNREKTIYKAISCSEKSIDINPITATLSNTAFRINIPVIKTDKIDYDLLHTGKSVYDKSALQKEYVETTDGKKFKPAARSDGDGGYSLPAEEKTIIDYQQTFNLTSFDATDKVKVHMFTNKGEEIVIEFEKSK